MFGNPLTEAQLLEQFQSCLKTSAQGVKFVKLKLRDVKLDKSVEECPL